MSDRIGVCMAYDHEPGNAYDCFEDTPDALVRRAKRHHGELTLDERGATAFVYSISSSLLCSASRPTGEGGG